MIRFQLRRMAMTPAQICVFAGLVLGMAPAAFSQARPAITPEQKSAIETIIRDYLLQNPDVIQDAMGELEKRQKDAEAMAVKASVRAEKSKIFDAPDSVVVGAPQGDVTLVEFFDYNCPYCKRSMENVEALMKADSKVRVVLRDFPVLGPESLEASRVALAVKAYLKGEKYWEFHKRLMSGPGRANKARALAIAKEMGLDASRIDKDSDSVSIRAQIEEATRLGDALSLRGTPAFVIGEEVIFGAVATSSLQAAVTAMRTCGQAVC